MKCHQHPPNSADLNPVENIWAHTRHIILKDYGHITSVKAIKHAVISTWNEFGDYK